MSTRLRVLVIALATAGVVALSVSPAAGSTAVGGILPGDATWTSAGNPYLVQAAVQVPAGVTLTIEAGVQVEAEGATDLFILNGTVRATGTAAEPVIIDGGGDADLFHMPSTTNVARLELTSCVLRNASALLPPGQQSGYSSFALRDSLLYKIHYYSYIWYPNADVHIEGNKFVEAAGFSVGHRDADVYVRGNYFVSRPPGLPGYMDCWVQNWASYDSSRTVVENNAFFNTSETALKLPPGSSSAALDGRGNYWGTLDSLAIAGMIYDDQDDITCASTIPYDPYLPEAPAPSSGLPHLTMRELTLGWNLIAGAPESTCGGITLFTYGGSSYESTIAERMQSGRGYWVRCSTPTQATLVTAALPLVVHFVTGWNSSGTRPPRP